MLFPRSLNVRHRNQKIELEFALVPRAFGPRSGRGPRPGRHLFFFVASSVVAYLNLEALQRGNERIVQTHVAIVSLDELLSLVQDAETGQRGFLLTNSGGYLAPYNAAVRAIRPKLDQIGQLTASNPGQSQRLVALRQHVDAKLAELGATIDRRRADGLEAAIAMVNSDRGKIEMDAVRAQIAAMSGAELEVRLDRLAEMENAQKTARLSTLLSGLLGIALTAAIALLIRKATIVRRRDEWLQAGQVGLASAMMGDQSIEQLSKSILDFLAPYAGAIAGAIFIRGDGSFQRACSRGVPPEANLPMTVRPREGLLGQAVAEGVQSSSTMSRMVTWPSVPGLGWTNHAISRSRPERSMVQ